MNIQRMSAAAGVLTLVLGGAVAGCGLKGQLAMPEKSGGVVVRGQSTTEAAPAGGATVPAKGTQATPKAEAPERMPPPDLPHSNGGSPR
jgi:predicted small lipoprotein YifL